MRKAATFFRTKAASHGGYVYYYAPDLSWRRGEGKATNEQIWVQPPGTPTVGLAYLKAFEATARLLSVKKAAAELSVTPAAVSHQIKALEDYLEVQLFHRHSRALELTEPARACLPKMREGFDNLAQAVERLRATRAAAC